MTKFRVNKPDGSTEIVDASASQVKDDGTLEFGKIGEDGAFVAEGASFAKDDFVSVSEGAERESGVNPDGTKKSPQPGTPSADKAESAT